MKLLGDIETEAVLERLDRLNDDEARTVAAQTLEVVYGLVKKMKSVMDGAWGIPSLRFTISYPKRSSRRQQDINRRYSTGLRCVSFTVRKFWMLSLGTSGDAANCNQHQQVPAFVVVYIPISDSLIRWRLQVISYKTSPDSGFLLWILQPTTTPHARLTTMELRLGLFMASLSMNGK